MKPRLWPLILCGALALTISCAHAATAAQVASGVGVEQHPGQQLPLSTVFHDERGASVPLASFFGTRPIVLTFVYYRCPNLCNLTLTNLLRSLERVDLTAGRDFDVVAVSIDPRETSQVAAAKRTTYVQQYERSKPGCDGCDEGWHFLTSAAPQSEALARAAGIRYVYDAAQDQYAHPAVALVVTPTGRIARYFNGIEFPPPELRWALAEARAGRTAGLADRFWLLCYHYDALVGRYSGLVQISTRLLAIATVLALGFLIFRLVRGHG
jgi:protein SCO1/2